MAIVVNVAIAVVDVRVDERGRVRASVPQMWRGRRPRTRQEREQTSRLCTKLQG